MLAGKPIAGAAPAGEDFVQNEQGVGCRAEVAQAGQPAGWGNDDAASSLQRLGQNGAGLVGVNVFGDCLQRAAVGEVLRKAAELRLKGGAEVGTGRGVQRSVGQAVVAAVKGKNAGAARRENGGFERGFDRVAAVLA